MTETVSDIVFRCIRSGISNAKALTREVRREMPNSENPYRAVDHALQNLRKRGKIQFTGKPRKWVVTS